jgi:hypothetical protein
MPLLFILNAPLYEINSVNVSNDIFYEMFITFWSLPAFEYLLGHFFLNDILKNV